MFGADAATIASLLPRMTTCEHLTIDPDSLMTDIDVMNVMTPLLQHAPYLTVLRLVKSSNDDDHVPNFDDVSKMQWNVPSLMNLTIPLLPSLLIAPLVRHVECYRLTPRTLYHLLARVPSLTSFMTSSDNNDDDYDGMTMDDLTIMERQPFTRDCLSLKLLLFRGDPLSPCVLPMMRQCPQLTKLQLTFPSWYVYIFTNLCYDVILLLYTYDI